MRQNEDFLKLQLIFKSGLSAYLNSECEIYKKLSQVVEISEKFLSEKEPCQCKNTPLNLFTINKNKDYRINPKKIKPAICKVGEINKNNEITEIYESACSERIYEDTERNNENINQTAFKNCDCSTKIHEIYEIIKNITELYEHRLSITESLINNSEDETNDSIVEKISQNIGLKYFHYILTLKNEFNSILSHTDKSQNNENSDISSEFSIQYQISSNRQKNNIYNTKPIIPVPKTNNNECSGSGSVEIRLPKPPTITKLKRPPRPMPHPRKITETLSIENTDPIIEIPNDTLAQNNQDNSIIKKDNDDSIVYENLNISTVQKNELQLSSNRSISLDSHKNKRNLIIEEPHSFKAHSNDLILLKKNCGEFLKKRPKIIIQPNQNSNNILLDSTCINNSNNTMQIDKEISKINNSVNFGIQKSSILPPINTPKNLTVLYPDSVENKEISQEKHRKNKICSACFICRPTKINTNNNINNNNENKYRICKL